MFTGRRSLRIPSCYHPSIVPMHLQIQSVFFFFFRSCLHSKGCCCLFGIFLAWETLNVTIPVLNDSKYIEMSVYNMFVLSIIGAVVSLTLEGSEYYDASYTILSMYLIMSTSLTMLFVFAPKVRILWLETYHLHM